MAKSAPDLWRITITVAEAAVAAFEAALEPLSDAVSWFMNDVDTDREGETWTLVATARHSPDRARLAAALELTAAAMGVAAPEAAIERIVDTDWVGANMRDFPPIAAGRFFVHGSHWRGAPPAGRLALMVDAGTAFGSGEHATTWGCLMAIDRLARRRRFRRPLDLGCGSGILAMAMAKVWHVPVLAADIDPESVRVAKFNAGRNRLRGLVRALPSDGYRHPAIGRRAPFDLIVANILARPLVSLAPRLAAHLVPGGMVVLSGLLARQERMVLAAHRLQGLSLVRRVAVNGWHTLVLRNG